MAEIQNQKLLYHLTSLTNVADILVEGLKPRSLLADFEDIADHEILDKRRALGLEDYVPFHWFAGNPFDGGVQVSRRGEKFVLITVRRTVAQANNWKVLARHPLANEVFSLLDYEDGFKTIDWKAMNRRDYHDHHSKSVCMAECLAPGIVETGRFFSIYVPDSGAHEVVSKFIVEREFDLPVNVNSRMFTR